MEKLTFLLLLVMFCGIGISGQTKRGGIKKKPTVVKKKLTVVKKKSKAVVKKKSVKRDQRGLYFRCCLAMMILSEADQKKCDKARLC